MGYSKSTTLPIIPLAPGSVLLPGVSLRIPVANRSDISNLLTSVFSRSGNVRPDTASISIGCVPLLPEAGAECDPGSVTKDGLFKYGTAAKIAGVQGRRPHELALLIEGVRRIRIDRVTQEKPYYEAEVSPFVEDGRFLPSENQNL